MAGKNLNFEKKWSDVRLTCFCVIPESFEWREMKTTKYSMSTTNDDIYSSSEWCNHPPCYIHSSVLVSGVQQHTQFHPPSSWTKKKRKKEKSCCYKDMLRATLVKRTLPKDCWIVLVCSEFLTSHRKKKVSYMRLGIKWHVPNFYCLKYTFKNI